MTRTLIREYVRLGIYKAEVITKDIYEREKDNNSSTYIYLQGMTSNGEYWFSKIDTQGLTEEDAKTMLLIKQADGIRSLEENIKSINFLVKDINKMVTFFFVLGILGLIFGIIGLIVQ